MTKRRVVLAALLGCLVLGLVAVAAPGALKVQSSHAAGTPIYQDTTYTFGERAADLVSRMTTAQKATQGNSSESPAIPSLGVAPYGWWNESLHGVARLSTAASGNAVVLNNTTSYPDNNSMGSTWDPNIVYQVGSAISDEAREIVNSMANTSTFSKNTDLDFYAPTINLARDPRWGRNDETWSEDPTLTATLASQYVDGMQGQTQTGQLLPGSGGYYKAINTLKHFTGYNSEVNRTSGDDDMDLRTLLEYDTAPFRQVVQSANPGSVMSSYNEVDTIPSAADTYLMDNLLRQTFGFTGYVTADCDAVEEITSAGHHWQPPNWTRQVNNIERNAVAQAAGEDLDCNAGFSDSFNYKNLASAVGEGIVNSTYNPNAYNSINGIPLSTGGNGTYTSVEPATDTYTVNDLDVSDQRLFQARFELGEFDPTANPYIGQAAARYQADYASTGATNTAPVWTNNAANNAITETPARLALAQKAADESLVLLKNNGNILPLHVPATGTYKIAVVGTLGNPSLLTGGGTNALWLGDYSSTQTSAVHIVDDYAGLKAAIQAINPTAQVDFYRGFTGTSNAAGSQTTVDTSGAPGSGTTADANSIYNLTGASGPYNAVVVTVGTDNGTGTEGVDRSTLTLPGAQATLIADVNALNPNTIVYMQGLGSIDVNSFDDPTPYNSDTQSAVNPPAILWSGYQSQTMGSALADVLLGNYNPSGHLSTTWVHDVTDLPNILDYDIQPNGPHGANGGAGPTPGRTYEYYSGPISYPFGYGLSYSTFSYSNLQIDNTSPTADGTIHVSVDVKNTSATTAGNGLVELYVNQPNAPAALNRPIKRLEGYQQVNLAPGATQTVTLTLKISSLAFYSAADSRFEVDDGAYGIQIATSAANADIQQSGTINVTGAMTPVLNVLSAKPNMTGDTARDIQARVMYPIGTTINPNLTASMSDDTLYGNIEIGQNKPFPSGMTFSYSSDRPSVVSVAPNGTLTTVANGAATITATATYQGVSKTTSFVARVLSELNGITVNGTALPGFTPDTMNYDMVLPNGAPAPTVAATDPDSGASISITQPTAVPGIATISDTGPDGVVLTYIVNFAYGAVGDNFNSTTLGSQWNITRPDTPSGTNWSLTNVPGQLQITPEAGDLSTSAATVHNLFLQHALGNWTVTSKLNFSVAPATNEQGGIIAYQSDQNFLKLYWTSTGIVVVAQDNLDGANVSQTLATVTTATIPSIVAAKTVWLRIAKVGPIYSTFYSADGVTWTPIYQVGQSLTNVQVGLYSEITTGTVTNGLKVSFDTFNVTTAVTTASISPTQIGGYSNSTPTITLSASNPGGAPIMSTMYQVDGGGWQLYTAPFTIAGEGAHTLQYYSTDTNGASEAINTQTVNVDETPPTTTASVSPTPVAGAVNGPATITLTPMDTFSGPASTQYSIDGGAFQTYTAPFTITAGGQHTVLYKSTDVAGNTETAKTLTIQVNPQATTSPSGTVSSTLSISTIGTTTPVFGTFAPGVAQTYNTTIAETVTSTAASSVLTATDPSSVFTGHLVNSTAVGGPYQLPSPLQADATDSVNPLGTFANVGSTASPETLLTYNAPVSSDAVTIGFQQAIGSTDPLRTGPYNKSIVITLSTSTP